MNQLLETNPAATFADYFKDKARYADFINYFLLAGVQLLDDSHLYDYDSDSSTVFFAKNKTLSVGKRRDIIMAARIDNCSVLIGIEHQQTIDYSMPYRLLMYDLIGYNQQYNRLDKNKKKYFQPIPIVPFVLYSGERSWNKPRTFAELLKIPKCLEGKFNDWRSNIFDIKDIDASKLHHPDNQKLVEAVQKIYQWNGNIRCLSEMIMSKEVAVMVATIVNQKELLGIIENEEKEEINMCTSITQAILQGELKGELKGELRGKKIGENEGKAKGTKIGKLAMLTTILNTRLETLSKEIEKVLEECTDEQLDTLAIHIFDIQNEDDVLKYIS